MKYDNICTIYMYHHEELLMHLFHCYLDTYFPFYFATWKISTMNNTTMSAQTVHNSCPNIILYFHRCSKSESCLCKYIWNECHMEYWGIWKCYISKFLYIRYKNMHGNIICPWCMSLRHTKILPRLENHAYMQKYAIELNAIHGNHITD